MANDTSPHVFSLDATGATSPDAASARDPRAETRYLRAGAAYDDGAYAEAAELYTQALDLAPLWIGAWMGLARAGLACDDRAQAASALRRALDLDPHDRHGAGLALARLSRDATPARAPDAYVTALFDDYAERFETHLTEGLGYSGPADLVGALRSAGFTQAASALDLGCGTGLCGLALRPLVDRLAGIDLSPRMVARAAGKSMADRPLYDRLDVGDLLAGLHGEEEASLDLVVAADVFIYVGDLAPVLVAAARALAPEGWLAFTAQTSETASTYALGEDLRFAHAPPYVAAVLDASGFAIVHRAAKSVRREKGRAVPGLVVVARRR